MSPPVPSVARRPRGLRAAVGLPLAAGIVVLLLPSTTATAVDPATVYVATTGSDTATGDATHPLRTITAALKRTTGTDTIVVGAGDYHESLKIEGRGGRTLKAAPGAKVNLDGSRAVTTWTPSGSVWVSDGWTARFDHSPTFTKGAPDGTRRDWQFINNDYPMAAYPEQLWIDGVAQRQVGSRAQVVPGTFFVDETLSQLVIGSDPAGKRVRASDLGKAISIRESGVTVDGINVFHFANSVPTMGAVTVDSPFTGIRLQNMTVNQNAVTGIFIGARDVTVSNVTANTNGMQGLMATYADNLRIDRLTTKANNVEHFNYAPVAGGARFGRMRNLTITTSTFTSNNGTGLWLDESVYNSKIYSSSMIGNAAHGMSLEISGTSKIADNVIADNKGFGAKINDSDNVEIWNNTILRNGRSINIAQDGRDTDLDGSWRDPSMPLTLRIQNITVRNNILGRQTQPANCTFCVEDCTRRFSAAQFNISTDANLYQRGTVGTTPTLVLWGKAAGAPDPYPTLPAFTTATGMEGRGREIAQNPPPVDSAYRTTAAVNALAPSTAVPVPTWLATDLGVSPTAPKLGAWDR